MRCYSIPCVFLSSRSSRLPRPAQVVLVKDEVAQIFGTSTRAKNMFPGVPAGAASAVCLARFLQDPVAEYANMWRSADAIGRFGFEVLFLDLHPLQSLLKDSVANLLTVLEDVLVYAVCEAGVDLNAAVQHDHLAGPLAFVAGLGLRKAEALRFNIQKQYGAISSRRMLLERKLMGKVVYNNSAGFLRICDNGNQTTLLDNLDDTRIHPESYIMGDFATKICSSALEAEHDAVNYYDNVARLMKSSKKKIQEQLRSENAKQWISTLENNALAAAAPNATVEQSCVDYALLEDSLEELELEEYATELEKLGQGKCLKLMCDVKNELRYPWLDRRRPLCGPNESELFAIATGETDNTIYVGMKVPVRIDVIRDKSVQVSLENGNLSGYVRFRNVEPPVDPSNRHNRLRDYSLNDILTVGTYKEGVIVAVSKVQRRVEVSLLESHVVHDEDFWFSKRYVDEFVMTWWNDARRPRQFDPAFDEQGALRLYSRRQEERRKELAEVQKAITQRENSLLASQASGPMNRQIYHPCFRNCSFVEAEHELRGKGAGEVIFRPSSQGPNVLAITWAFQDGIFKHIDITEEDKQNGPAALGSRLIIKGEKEPFSDLDEIMGRYITPMNDFVAKTISHRKFRPGLSGECNEYLKQCYTENPMMTPLLLRFDYNHPGYFVISWYAAESKSSPFKAEFIKVTPEVKNILLLKV
jgi:transcription elongation factor SPT6